MGKAGQPTMLTLSASFGVLNTRNSTCINPKMEKNSLNCVKPIIAFTMNNEEIPQLEMFLQPGCIKTLLDKYEQPKKTKNAVLRT